MPESLPTTPGIARLIWGADSAVAIHESPVTFAHQVYRWPGQRLKFTARLPPMRTADARAWFAAMLHLNGPEKTFYFRDAPVGRNELGHALPGGSVFNTPQTVTVTVIDDAITATAHGLTEGDRVRMFSDGTLPAGLSPLVDYYVRVIDVDTFSVSLSQGAAVVFTTDFATDANQIDSVAHGLRNGDTVNLASTLSLPAGLLYHTEYFVVSRAPNSFEVSLTKGGAPITLTSDGSGVLTWSRAETVDITDTGSGTHSVEKRQSGESLLTSGWAANTIQLFRAGDWVGIDDTLHRVLIDSDSDANGRAALKLFPRISVPFDGGEPVRIGSEPECRGTFRLSGAVALTTEVSRLAAGFEFSGVQAI